MSAENNEKLRPAIPHHLCPPDTAEAPENAKVTVNYKKDKELDIKAGAERMKDVDIKLSAFTSEEDLYLF